MKQSTSSLEKKLKDVSKKESRLSSEYSSCRIEPVEYNSRMRRIVEERIEILSYLIPLCEEKGMTTMADLYSSELELARGDLALMNEASCLDLSLFEN